LIIKISATHDWRDAVTDESTTPHLTGTMPGIRAVDGPQLLAEVQSLARAANFAAVTTLLPGGQPQTQITWVDADGDHLLVNTVPFSQKYRNIRRDPRVTVLIWDREDPERYAEVRGRVLSLVTGSAAVEHVDRLAHRYLGGSYRGPAQRVVLRIEPIRQLVRRSPWG
jgi:PPOX class probable F420-dependent enzyme